MPNDYFQFKEFRIEQADCAQKVSTDACLLGAAANLDGATRILDIGTGTGLLALMAAQRALGAEVEAVELDPAAAAQAAANVAASPWPGRVRVRAQSLAEFAALGPVLFSHILCNPPFFRRSLLPPGAARATARHASDASLTFEEIASFATRFLQPLGRLAVLLPPPEMAHFAQVAQRAGLHPLTRLAVRHRPGGRLTRCIHEFGLGAAAPPLARELTVEALGGTGYSEEFRRLLAPFYLHL